MVIGLGGGGISSRAAGRADDRAGAGRARRAGRLAGGLVVDRAFVLAGVEGRTAAEARFAAAALALTGAGETAAGGGVTSAAVGAAGGGTAIVTGADGVATTGAAWPEGTGTALDDVTVESGTGAPSSPSMNGFAIQS